MIYKGMICQWCGATFTAQKSSTRYCSKRCAEHANKQRMRELNQYLIESHNTIKSEERCHSARNNTEILSPLLLGQYLGVSRTTAYDYIGRGIIPAMKVRGKTFIRRSDIDKLFDSAPPYKIRVDDTHSASSSATTSCKESQGERYTTVKEVAEKYGLSLSGADKILKESGITLIRHKSKHYYYLNEVESLFRKREAESHPEITEWYTCAEIQERFKIKPATIYDIVCSYKIPSKKVHRVSYYSKVHFDMYRGLKPADSDKWYTVQDAMDRFGQTRDQVYGVLRYNKIQRVQVGRNVKFRRRDYDDAMKFYTSNKI